MALYRQTAVRRSRMKVPISESRIGETIEQKMRRLLRDKEPIKDLAPQVFTERKDGVRPEFNIRTDKWEVSAEAKDKLYQARQDLKDANKEGKVVKLDDKGNKTKVDKEQKSGGEAPPETK